MWCRDDVCNDQSARDRGGSSKGARQRDRSVAVSDDEVGSDDPDVEEVPISKQYALPLLVMSWALVSFITGFLLL